MSQTTLLIDSIATAPLILWPALVCDLERDKVQFNQGLFDLGFNRMYLVEFDEATFQNHDPLHHVSTSKY